MQGHLLFPLLISKTLSVFFFVDQYWFSKPEICHFHHTCSLYYILRVSEKYTVAKLTIHSCLMVKKNTQKESG